MNPQEMVATRLGRARMLVLAFGILLVLLSAGQLDASSDVLPLSVAALIAEIGILLGTAWRQQHVTILEAPATAVLAVLVGISLHNPLASTWICIGVIMTQTLYDGRLSPPLRLISFIGVLPLSTGLSASPVGAQIGWNSPASLTPVALIPLFLSLMIMLKGALESQERSLAREHFLGTTSGKLLAARNPGMVNAILARRSRRCATSSPGSRW